MLKYLKQIVECSYRIYCEMSSRESWILLVNCRMKTQQSMCVDVAVLYVLGVGAWVSTVGPEVQGGEKLWDALGDLWLMVGLGERILKTSLPERHLWHSWALLPISLQHLPSPLSYKSQWPLLFQSPLREGRWEGLCWQTWIFTLSLAVCKSASRIWKRETLAKPLPEKNLILYLFGICNVLCKYLDRDTFFVALALYLRTLNLKWNNEIKVLPLNFKVYTQIWWTEMDYNPVILGSVY